MTQQNIWLTPAIKAAIDAEVASGRFRSRTQAIEAALASVFERSTA